MNRRRPRKCQNFAHKDSSQCLDSSHNNSLYRVGVRHKTDTKQISCRFDKSEKKGKGPPCVASTSNCAKRLLPPTELCILSQEPRDHDSKPYLEKQSNKKPRRHLRTFQWNIEDVDSQRPKVPFYESSKARADLCHRLNCDSQSPRVPFYESSREAKADLSHRPTLPVSCLLKGKGKKPIQILAKVVPDKHAKKRVELEDFCDYGTSGKKSSDRFYHRSTSSKKSRHPSKTIHCQLQLNDSEESCDDGRSSLSDDVQESREYNDVEEEDINDYLTCALSAEDTNPCRGNAGTRRRRHKTYRVYRDDDELCTPVRANCMAPYPESPGAYESQQALVPVRPACREGRVVQKSLRQPRNLLAQIRQNALPTYAPPQFKTNYRFQVCPKCKESSIDKNEGPPCVREKSESKEEQQLNSNKISSGTTTPTGPTTPAGATTPAVHNSKEDVVKSEKTDPVDNSTQTAVTQPPSTCPSPPVPYGKDTNTSFGPNWSKSFLPNVPFLSGPTRSSRFKVYPCEATKYQHHPYEIIKVDPDEMPIALCGSNCAEAAKNICLEDVPSCQRQKTSTAPSTPPRRTTRKEAARKAVSHKYCGPNPVSPPIGAATDLHFDRTPEFFDMDDIPSCKVPFRCKVVHAFLTALRWIFTAFLYALGFVVINVYYDWSIFSRITLQLTCLFLIFLLQFRPEDLFIHHLMGVETEKSN